MKQESTLLSTLSTVPPPPFLMQTKSLSRFLSVVPSALSQHGLFLRRPPGPANGPFFGTMRVAEGIGWGIDQ